jgi:hypothetical protein
VYGLHPKIPINITSLPLPQKTSEVNLDFATFISFLHGNIRCKMAEQVAKYVNKANRHRKDMQWEWVS